MTENNDKGMKKYIGSVALKTLCFLLVLLLLFVGVFLLAFPKEASNTFAKMGMQSLSSRFSKTAYMRSDDINDIANAYNSAVSSNNYDLIVNSGELFLKDENFSEYVSFMNEQMANSSYGNFVSGNMAIAYFERSEKEKAMQFVAENIAEKYDGNSASSYLIYHLIDQKKTDSKAMDMAVYLIENLEIKFSENKIEGYNLKALCADAYALADHYDIGDKEAWRERYAVYQ